MFAASLLLLSAEIKMVASDTETVVSAIHAIGPEHVS